jgi:carbon-monoxide dehydrogenase medium subunit
MIPADFSYTRAHSVADALRLLGEHGGDAKILSGGHSLVPAMKLRLNQPGALIDVARIPELRYIRQDGNHIAIGAASTHADIAGSDLLAKHVAMFPQAAKLIGDVQVRNRGTIGGSIAHADPAADWPAILLAADAVVVVHSAGGSRSIPAADFFTGFYSTALEEGELITEIRVPVPVAGTHSSYQKFMQPASRFAIVGCAAVVAQNGGVCSHVRVAFTGVSDGPFRDTQVENALSGKAANADNVAAAAAQAAQGVNLLSDHFASEKYRLHLAQVFAKRALSDVTA